MLAKIFKKISENPENLCDSEPVGGEFAISGILPFFRDVLDNLEKKKEFSYGYFRFADHPYIRKIKTNLQSHFNFRHCLLYCSLSTGLHELVRDISVNESGKPKRLLLIDLNQNYSNICQLISSIDLTIIESVDNLSSIDECGSQDIIVINAASLESLDFYNTQHNNCISGKKVPVIAIFENPADTISQSSIVSYYLLTLNSPTAHIKGCALLSNKDRQMNEMKEQFRNRGALLSSRNAAFFIKDEKETRSDPILESQLKQQICELENGESAFLFPSGMNAIATILDILVKPDKNEVISIGHLYTDTYSMLRNNSDFEDNFKGININMQNLHNLEEYITDKTAMIITESITNPLNDVPDISFVSEIANRHHIPVIIDNTIATPFNMQPLQSGSTAVVHSTTKFLNGENNHGGGAVITNDVHIADKISNYQASIDNKMSVFEMKVLLNNLKDFENRMIRFNRNATTIARILESHPRVKKVYSNCLNSHQSHHIAIKLLKGPGGVISFTLQKDDLEGLQRFYDTTMNQIIKAPSLGSNRTLLCPYTMLAHYNESDEMLDSIGLSRYLIRLSVGCENDIQPIVDDIIMALENV